MDLREALEAVGKRLRDVFTFDLKLDLSPEKLAPFELGAADIDGQLASHESGLFLGVYDEPTVQRGLEAAGWLGVVRGRVGAPGLRVRLQPSESVFRVYRDDRPEGPDALVIELKLLHERALSDGLRRLGFPPCDRLAIEWMLLQDPGKPFPPGRRALPGQSHPGLGLGWHVLDLLRRAAERLRCGALVAIPAFYHTAVLYHRMFAFADPVHEGLFEALLRDLAALPLADAAEAVHEGRVRCARTGKTVRWEGKDMVLPLCDEVRAYLERPEYGETAAKALAEATFAVV